MSPGKLPGAAAARPRAVGSVGGSWTRCATLLQRSRPGRAAVMRRPDGLFGPGSVIWRVHGDVTTMMIGGIAALLLQMLHPAVLAGVWDHRPLPARHARPSCGAPRASSRSPPTAARRKGAAMAQVRAIPELCLRYSCPTVRAYTASDPRLLGWCVTEAVSLRCQDPLWRAGDVRGSRSLLHGDCGDRSRAGRGSVVPVVPCRGGGAGSQRCAASLFAMHVPGRWLSCCSARRPQARLAKPSPSSASPSGRRYICCRRWARQGMMIVRIPPLARPLVRWKRRGFSPRCAGRPIGRRGEAPRCSSTRSHCR